MRAPSRFLRLLGAAMALTLVGAACGDDDDSADAPSDEATDDISTDDGGTDDEATDDEAAEDDDDDATGADPCSLLTADDLAQTFGTDRMWDDGDATEVAFQGQQCTWATSDEQLPVMSFYAVVYDGGALEDEIGQSAEEYFGIVKEATEVTEELSLGDESYLAGNIIYVLDGDTIYSFSTVLGTSAEAIAGLKALAEQVVG